MNQEAKLKRQWEYLNKLGLYTVEDVIEVYKLNKRR